MISTVVRHNFVPNCFDIMNTTETTTLKLKLAKPLNNEVTPEFGNWGFLLQKGDDDDDDDTKASCFSLSHPPPPSKPFFSTLSSKSLELCTENLGSETGSDIVTDGSSIFSCSPPLTPSSNSAHSAFNDFAGDSDKETEAISALWSSYKIRDTTRGVRDFPPPLTTLTGSNSLRLCRRPAEDGGRLIIEAVETPFRNSYLQAERSDGRLRLCFVTAEPSCTSDEEEEEDDDDKEDEQEEISSETTGDAPIDDFGIELESNKEELDEEIDREIEMEKFRRPSRCKDGRHGREGLCCSWKPPIWVATK